jgi:hypothetical protein
MLPLAVHAQTQTIALLEDFEDATVEYVTSDGEFSDGTADFFTRTDGSNVSTSYEVTGADGSFYFAAQDINGEGGPDAQSITFGGIDITGLSALSFSALFAEDDDFPNEDYDEPDYVRVYVSIDGAPETQIFGIENNGDTFNSPPFVDTDLDGTGDGTEITESFSPFSAAIAGTGSTLDLRIEISLDSGDEDIAIDNVAIQGMASNLPPEIIAAPAGPLTVHTGDPIDFTVEFTPPEADQTIADVTSTDVDGIVCGVTLGAPGAVTTVQCTGSIATPGSYAVDIAATDDGSPPLTTSTTVEIMVAPPPQCDVPTLADNIVDETARTISNTISDQDGIAGFTFSTLNNFTVASIAPMAGFTRSGDTWTWTGGGPAPTSVDFTLQAGPNGEALYFLVVTDACTDPGPNTTDFDPPFDLGPDAALAFGLADSYPNPTRGSATVSFSLGETSPVTLAVYDVMGRKVATLVDGAVKAGQHEVRWSGRSADGSAVASGVYLLRLEAGDRVATRRLTVVK